MAKKSSNGGGRKNRSTMTLNVGKLAAGIALAAATFPDTVKNTLHFGAEGNWPQVRARILPSLAQDIKTLADDPINRAGRVAVVAVGGGLLLKAAKSLPTAQANLGLLKIRAA